MTKPRIGGLRVVVLAGKQTRARCVDQLPYRFVGVGKGAVVTDDGYRALGQGVWVVNADTGKTPAERAGRAAIFSGDDYRTLGRLEAVPHRAVETTTELGDIAIARLVAERDPQRVLVVILLGCGQDVGCTAFGSPLVPEVKIIMKVSVGTTSR